MSLTIQQWKNTNLVPLSGMLAWHSYEPAVSGHNIVYDYSGNGRTISCGVGNSPVLIANIIGGQPAWYFNGSRDPLKWTGSVTPKHAFVLASADEGTFSDYRGLLTGATLNELLVGEASATRFYNYGLSTAYYKSGVPYAAASMTAPMNGAFALIEIQFSAGILLDGIQVGQHKNLASRFWKGYWAETIMFDRILSETERQAVNLYFGMRYGLSKSTGLPIYFPSDNIIPIKRRRFYAEPPEYDKVTESVEYEDGGRDFNETNTDAPRSWEYEYELVNAGASTDPPAVYLFDEFYDTVRKSRPFSFTDKYGTTWSNVRVNKYSRTHAKNQPWRQQVKFDLIKYPNS